MNTWQKWVKRPQKVWLRRALFQVHLWSGIGLGLYVLVVCLSGSAAVFNSELYTAFLPQPRFVAIAGRRMTRAELKDAAQRIYPGSAVGRITLPRDLREASVVSLGAPGVGLNADQRFFDPYTGKDLGSARPFGLRMVSFFSQLHMTLLMGYAGRVANGIGGLLVAMLSFTGLVIWWPGIRRWRASLTLRPDARFKRLNWDLHSAIGFWTFAIVFMWAITGVYLVFPGPFARAIDFISPAGHRIDLRRVLHSAHVGDFAGWPVKVLWAVLGLAPPVLFVTGSIMWWCRVLNPWLKRAAAVRSRAKESRLPAPGRIFEAGGMGQF